MFYRITYFVRQTSLEFQYLHFLQITSENDILSLHYSSFTFVTMQDVLKIKPNLECLSCCGRNLEYRQSRDCGRSCCKASSQIGCRQRSMSRSQKSKSPVRASKRKHFVPNTVYTKEFKTVQKSTFVTDSSVGFSRQR